MTDNTFFDEPSEQSQLKASIVAKYFSVWSSVIIPQVKKTSGKSGRIGYFDLFAGTGRYNDGTKSTPLLILEQAVQRNDLQQMLVTIFNDQDKANCQRLKKAIDEIPGIKGLKYPPSIHQEQVGAAIIRMFSEKSIIPSLIFLDPWGYKGLHLDLINSVVKDWACECIFFFNYLRVNMALENNLFQSHVDGLFGKSRADRIRSVIPNMTPLDREEIILDELVAALKEKHGKYVLRFRFRSPDKSRTSHYLVFVTKNFRGYEIMKDIMAGASSKKEQDVPSFEYDPNDRNRLQLDIMRPRDKLEKTLPSEMSGKTLTMQQIYEQHSVGTPYIKRNYKTVLVRLETAGLITANPSRDKRRKGTFADNVEVTFL